jgi:hypothetical protein
MSGSAGEPAGARPKEPTMSRTARIVTTTGLALAISLLTAAPWADAQEMEHGRPRPTAKAVMVNQAQTHDQAMLAAIANVRG